VGASAFDAAGVFPQFRDPPPRRWQMCHWEAPVFLYDSTTVLRKKSSRSKISLDLMPERMTKQIGMGISAVPKHLISSKWRL